MRKRIILLTALCLPLPACALSEITANVISSIVAAGAGIGGYYTGAGVRILTPESVIDNHPYSLNTRVWAGVSAALAGVTVRLLVHKYTPTGRYSQAKKIFLEHTTKALVHCKLSDQENTNITLFKQAGCLNGNGIHYSIQAHFALAKSGKALEKAHNLLDKARSQTSNIDLTKSINELSEQISLAQDVVAHNLYIIENNPQYASIYRAHAAERSADAQDKMANAQEGIAAANTSRETRGWLTFVGRALSWPVRVLLS
jgi:hypothetical protein